MHGTSVAKQPVSLCIPAHDHLFDWSVNELMGIAPTFSATSQNGNRNH
jgi:hypothetical protein